MPCPVAGRRAANAKKDRQTNGTVSVIAMSYPTAFWYLSWPPVTGKQADGDWSRERADFCAFA